MRRPSEHLRPASSLKPSPTLTEPRPGDLWPGRDCRREFRQARSRTPIPDSVLAVGGMTDGVWQGGSVMSTPRRGPCRAFRHDRGRRKTPRDPLARAIADTPSVPTMVRRSSAENRLWPDKSPSNELSPAERPFHGQNISNSLNHGSKKGLW